MDPETKTIQRDSLVDLLEASRAQTAKPHAHTIRRTQRVRRERQREPSALRGLILLLLLALAARSLVIWLF